MIIRDAHVLPLLRLCGSRRRSSREESALLGAAHLPTVINDSLLPAPLPATLPMRPEEALRYLQMVRRQAGQALSAHGEEEEERGPGSFPIDRPLTHTSLCSHIRLMWPHYCQAFLSP